MATHDYVIDNSTGANVRADINLVLQAILTNNSSSSAPSTTAAYMWWADTTNGVLKIRNSSNNDWVELLQLDGTLTLEDGSASTPGLAFRDDLNTGIFSSASDTFNVATAGVERMELGATTIFNEDGADVDFRIEGDTNANLFYVDAGNNKIGIGTATPSNLLHLKSGAPAIQFEDTDANGSAVSIIEDNNGFLKLRCDTGNAGTGSGIGFEVDGSERMRIDTSGRVLIGTTTTDNYDGINSSLQVSGTGGDTSSITISRFSADVSNPNLILAKSRNGTVAGNTVLQANDICGSIQFHGNDGGGFHQAASISSKIESGIGSDDVPANLIFSTNGGSTSVTERMRIDSSGNVGIGTASPSEKLTISSGNLNFIGGTNDAQYIKFGDSGDDDIGNIFYFHGNNNMVFTTNASEAMRIDSSGNVGIGTTSPSTTLTVSGTSDGVLNLDTSDSRGAFVRFGQGGTFAGNSVGCADGLTSGDKEDLGVRAVDNIIFASGGSTERMRLHGGTHQLQIGGTTLISSSPYLTLGQSGNSQGNIVHFVNNGTQDLKMSFISAGKNSRAVGIDVSTDNFFIGRDSSDNDLAITNSGQVLVGTGGVGGGSGGVRLQHPDNGTSRFGTTITSGNITYIQFISNGANNIVGSISGGTSTTSFNTTSDYRLKENESLISDGITRLKQLKPYRFNWKADSSTIVDGFFAHEVSSIVPESITGTKDAVAVQEDVDKGIADAIGEPIYQSIDQAKLVPLLVAAVKELITKVETLEAA